MRHSNSIKKIIAGIAALMLVSTLHISATELTLKADVNGDGKVSVVDLTQLKQYLLGENTNISADVNQDGTQNVFDAIALKNILLSENTVTELLAPSFNYESGFYSDTINVQMSTKTSNSNIYYTTDGSDPTVNSSLYTGAIEIKDRSNQANVLSAIGGISPAPYKPSTKVAKGTVIKAVTIDANGNVSDVVTKSYFIGLDQQEKYSGVPVVSLVTDKENLFNYDTGIYVKGVTYDNWIAEGGDVANTKVWLLPGNYMERGREWERNVHLDFIEGNGTLGLSQELGIRIMGSASRRYCQKSLRLYAREEYGKKNIKYNLIPNLTKEIDDITPLTKFRTVVLRTGGNDCYETKFKDAYIQSLVTDRNFDTQGSTPVVVFINGEYWGVYIMQEDYTDNYIENNYDVNNDDVVMVKMGEIEEGNDEDINLYNDFVDFIVNNDLSKTENYNTVLNMMDMNNFIDYYCTEMYIGNEDWLYKDNNWMAWRSRSVTNKPYQDGKWRWLLYDTEFSLITANYNSISTTLHPREGAEAGSVFLENLIVNDDFKQQFVTTFMDIANVNFQPKHALEVLDTYANQYSPLMQDFYKRFGPNNAINDDNAYFNNKVSSIKSFLKSRYDYVPKMIKSECKLSGNAVNINLAVNDANKGKIKINTVTPDLSTGEWTGKYFTDYPITLTAICSDGYSFAGWEGYSNTTDQTITVSFNEAISLKAIFK